MNKLLLLLVLYFLLLPSPAFTQVVKAKTQVTGNYTFDKGMCSSSFLFLPGGLFYFEGGCEERSFILKGGYKILKDTIKFFPDVVPIRYSIKNTLTTSKRKLSISFLDNEGKSLPFFHVFALAYPIYGDTLNYIQSLEADSNGILMIDTSNYKAFSFDRYNPKRLNKDNNFKWETLSSFNGSANTVQFNYPIFCLNYSDIQVAGGVTDLRIINGQDALKDNENNIYYKTKN